MGRPPRGIIRLLQETVLSPYFGVAFVSYVLYLMASLTPVPGE